MDIKTFSELLGHHSPAVTLRICVRTDMELKRNALNMITKKLSKTALDKILKYTPNYSLDACF